MQIQPVRPVSRRGVGGRKVVVEQRHGRPQELDDVQLGLGWGRGAPEFGLAAGKDLAP